jgi:hypothetical protein
MTTTLKPLQPTKAVDLGPLQDLLLGKSVEALVKKIHEFPDQFRATSLAGTPVRYAHKLDLELPAHELALTVQIVLEQNKVTQFKPGETIQVLFHRFTQGTFTIKYEKTIHDAVFNQQAPLEVHVDMSKLENTTAFVAMRFAIDFYGSYYSERPADLFAMANEIKDWLLMNVVAENIDVTDSSYYEAMKLAVSFYREKFVDPNVVFDMANKILTKYVPNP